MARGKINTYATPPTLGANHLKAHHFNIKPLRGGAPINDPRPMTLAQSVAVRSVMLVGDVSARV